MTGNGETSDFGTYNPTLILCVRSTMGSSAGIMIAAFFTSWLNRLVSQVCLMRNWQLTVKLRPVVKLIDVDASAVKYSWNSISAITPSA